MKLKRYKRKEIDVNHKGDVADYLAPIVGIDSTELYYGIDFEPSYYKIKGWKEVYDVVYNDQLLCHINEPLWEK